MVVDSLRALAPTWAKRGLRSVLPRRDYVLYRGSRLPRPESRLNQEDQSANEVFLSSSIAESRRVIQRLGCTGASVLVDIGCGQGRLPIGLARELPLLSYLGLDVSPSCVAWCNHNIESRHPSYRFRHIDLVNARYYPDGSPMTDSFRLPVGDEEADIVYLWGVVTNMEPEHLPAYAREIGRMLKQGGRAFLTVNIETGVPRSSINPENYVSFEYSGPMNIVRYEQDYFLDVFRRAGLVLTGFDYHAAGNCQSELYFAKDPIVH